MSQHGDFLLDDFGSTNQGFDEESMSNWSETESNRRPIVNLSKRNRKERNVFRKGPAPLEDVKVSGEQTISSYPGNLDDSQRQKSFATVETDIDQVSEDADFSNAGSRGLLTYFAKLSSSPDNEQIDGEFVDSLLRGGADINVTDTNGQTIMHEIVREWNIESAEFCFARLADIDKPDNYGRTPLHLASAVNYPEMIGWLISKGADVHKRTSGENQSPIHYAAKSNALDAMKVLLELGANILDRDYKDRMPLFVAAEAGRCEACRFLLEFGAPAGIYDDCGTSALSLMIEKMPDVAKEALGQFQMVDNALRRKYYYLNYLELETWRAVGSKKGKPLRQSFARSPLEVIVRYNELNLIMHPVILNLIQLKWNLFGKKHALLFLAINFIYTLIWTAIGITIPKKETVSYYSPVNKHWWRVALEVVGCTMTLAFLVQQLLEHLRVQKLRRSYQDWKVREIERDFQYCHPQWPEEKRFLKSEVDLVNSSSSAAMPDPWDIFEWITFAGILICIVTRGVAILTNDLIADKVHHRVITFTLILVWLRLMKYCRPFQSLGPFITMLGHVIGATVKFAFLFFEIFIPYCCAFWILFGEQKGTEFEYFNDLIYQVFMMTLVADYEFSDLTKKDKVIAQILVGTYLALAGVVCLNLYIALMSETFSRVWSAATANAYMSQAFQLLVTERALGGKDSERVRTVLLEECSPQIVQESSAMGNAFNEKEMINILSLKVEEMNGVLHSATEDTSSMLSEIDKLNNELTDLRKNQETVLNEILLLTRESSSSTIKNLLTSVQSGIGSRMKQRLAKMTETRDEDADSNSEEPIEKSKSFLPWKK